MLDQPVVLGVEDVVDGGQADVLVGAAVAGDVVRVEQFVVVLAVGRRIVGIAQADFDVAVGEPGRHSVVGDVGEEGVAGADRIGQAIEHAKAAVGNGIAFDQCRRRRRARHHHLRIAVGAADELPYGSVRAAARCRRRRRSSWMPSMSRACALTSAQVAMPPLRALDAACRWRPDRRRR